MSAVGDINEVHALIDVMRHNPDAPLPRYATPESSGFDLHAPYGPHAIPPHGRLLVRTGLAFALPPGFELQIRPRSGLALKHGIMVLNSPGTIDRDFRGEVGVLLFNTTDEPYIIGWNDRIAQAVVAPVARAALRVVEALPDTTRGTGGWGHSGT